MASSSTSVQTILFLAANPKSTGRLRLDQELRDISEGLQRSQNRKNFRLEQRLAVRPRDIQRAILDLGPQIIHFSGHGAGEKGLVFEDEAGNTKLVNGDALAALFELFSEQIQCVVLNGCYSKIQAKAIARHIPYVIGMNEAIGDEASIAFAIGFYDALGAGRDIEFAHRLGCASIRLEGIDADLMPSLLKGNLLPQNTNSVFKAPQPIYKAESKQLASTKTEGSQQRQQLFQRLISLPGSQFEKLVFVLAPPAGNLPPISAPLGQRVPALLEWAESSIGCGLGKLIEVLESIESSDLSKKSIKVPVSPAISEEVCFNLSHLANRKEQTNKLLITLKTAEKLIPPKPIIFMIHGNVNQCHDVLLKRFKDFYSYDKLGMGRDLIIEDYRLSWPHKLENLSKLEEEIRRNLAQCILKVDSRIAGITNNFEINQFLSLHPVPVLIHTQIHTEDWMGKDWKNRDYAILENFLDFWQKWPQLGLNQILVICLLIKYQDEPNANWLRKLRYKKANQHVREHLETLSNSKFDHIISVVLPELRDVGIGEAEDWAYMDEVVKVFGNSIKVQLVTWIDEYYREWGTTHSTGEIPMASLTKKLKDFLWNDLCVRGLP